ncbi:MAG: sigma-54-dependent Fis family transcriptional regulator, partial [Polaromonas sp.]|nr:sigma-54-dependent Fis family transcriptional regulator [Polaromonas sp.]
EDLPDLAHALLRRICAESGQAAPALSPGALNWLQSCELPGNVRELENLLQRALALSNGAALQPEDFGEPGDHPLAEVSVLLPTTTETLPDATAPVGSRIPPDLQTYLDEQERQVLLQALKETDFNRTAAAARLGLNLRQMRYRIQRLGIAMPSGSDDEA